MCAMGSSLLLLLLFPGIGALKCWNCVGADCDVMGGPSWTETECPSGSQCQKTTLHFYSNVANTTMISTAVRSCSYERGCMERRTERCMRDLQQFAGNGCPERVCCSTDLCNSAASAAFLPLLLLSLIA